MEYKKYRKNSLNKSPNKKKSKESIQKNENEFNTSFEIIPPQSPKSLE